MFKVADPQAENLLKHFHKLAPNGFGPHSYRTVPGVLSELELQYRHSDGRRQVLRVDRYRKVVYLNEFLPKAS